MTPEELNKETRINLLAFKQALDNFPLFELPINSVMDYEELINLYKKLFGI